MPSNPYLTVYANIALSFLQDDEDPKTLAELKRLVEEYIKTKHTPAPGQLTFPNVDTIVEYVDYYMFVQAERLYGFGSSKLCEGYKLDFYISFYTLHAVMHGKPLAEAYDYVNRVCLGDDANDVLNMRKFQDVYTKMAILVHG